MTLIFNASPIIVLAKCGLIDRLLSLAATVVIPAPVAQEIVSVDDPRDPARIWLDSPSCRLLIREAPETLPFIMAWDLGPGESSVLTLATTTHGSMVVLDDLSARHCAQALGLPLVGTLGLVLLAKQRGILPSVSSALDAICAAGLFISQRHLSVIRERAGE